MTAVNLEEPDIVPITDLGLAAPIVEGITGIKAFDILQGIAAPVLHVVKGEDPKI